MGFTAGRYAVSNMLDIIVLRVRKAELALRISLRKTTPPTYPRAASLLAENPYTPPSTLAQAIMNASRLLSELAVIREWLHDTAPSPPQLDANTGYWKFTKHQTMQALRMNKPSALKEMDPDAVNRGDDGALAVDDSVRRILATYVQV